MLQVYKFTNAYRASDRVSQYLVRHVIYRADLPKSATETVFRTLLFKFFNRIETWELLEQRFGAITYSDFDVEAYGSVLDAAMRRGESVYSGCVYHALSQEDLWAFAEAPEPSGSVGADDG